jgi:hypothetical protein
LPFDVGARSRDGLKPFADEGREADLGVVEDFPMVRRSDPEQVAGPVLYPAEEGSPRGSEWLRACERGPDVREFWARGERFSLINIADFGTHLCVAERRWSRFRRVGQRPGG